MSISIEENPTYLWLNDNLKVVIGVSLSVRGTCILVPICIAIAGSAPKTNRRMKLISRWIPQRK